jgi:F0F1-type ATP synthase epsilon subunit
MPEDKAADTSVQATDQSKPVKAEKKQAPKEGDKFHAKIYSPYKVYFEGDIVSLSAENATGPFDILAGHHNFLTLLSPCEIIARKELGESDDKSEKIKITRGIMHVKADDVVIFLDV